MRATAFARGDIHENGAGSRGGGSQDATALIGASGSSAPCPTIPSPRLTVRQNCPANLASPGGILTYSGSVSNAGNTTLADIVVTSDRSGSTPVFTRASLAPGASVAFTGSYLVPPCHVSITSTLTASGNDPCTGVTVTDTDTDTCPLFTIPRLSVTLICPVNPVPVGGLFGYSGSVSNSGDVNITNVFVFGSQPSANTLLLGPTELAPGEAQQFSGSYIVMSGSNPTNFVTVTNRATSVTTNSVTLSVTNSVGTVTTNNTVTVTPSTVTVTVTNSVGTITTNSTVTITPSTVTVTVTNNVGTVITNQTASITTNTTSLVTTNSVPVVTTNTVTVIVTNSAGTGPSAAVASTFGTISPAGGVGTVTDRFVVGTNFHGLTYADEDHGYAATKFYSVRHDAGANTSFFDTIAPTGATGTITDRFNLAQNNFDALAYAAPDVGYGPVIFYYLRHDTGGLSTFGSITPGGVVGVVADHKTLGPNFVALTFSATDVGYGANLFYYVRRDANCDSFFGTIDPAQGGPVVDRFRIGANVDALVFTSTDVGYGANHFYYLRHDGTGRSTFGTIFVTGQTSGTVTDRFFVGTNVTELSFTTTDVLYGPNLFYYLRGTPKAGCAQITLTTNTVTSLTTNTVPVVTTETMTTFTTNTVTTLTTNTVPVVTTETVTTFTTNTVTTLTTNTVPVVTTETITTFTTNTVTTVTTNTVPTVTEIAVTASGIETCEARTVTAAANCPGPLTRLAAPVISSVTVANGLARISWTATPGTVYCLQSKSGSKDSPWKNVPGTITARGATAFKEDPIGSDNLRFYRVMVLLESTEAADR